MKKIFKLTLSLLLCIGILCSCGNTPELIPETFNSDSVETIPEYTPLSDNTDIKDKKEQEKETTANDPLDKLTLNQKICQLFIVRPESLNSKKGIADGESNDGTTEFTKTMATMLKKYPVCGVCQFGKNIVNPEQIKTFNEDLQNSSKIPMFITVDEEGGIVARLANNDSFDLPKYKSATDVASSGNDADARDMGKTIGKYLIEYGFNMDFAPDADVDTNPNNPIIGTRAFSSDAKTAAKMVSAAADGFRTSGILPTLKHFPGHGDTAEDSHTSLAITNKSLEELENCEFLTFQADSGMHAVMVGHIAAPKVTGNNTPASLSSELVDLIPNKEDTLIITDSLEMQAISDKYSSGEAALKAFEAGCDILLMPENLTEAYDAILHAVADGTISEERLNTSVRKILKFKQQFVDESIEY